MRTRILAAALAALASLASLPAAAQTLKPGLWEIHSKMDNPEMAQAMAQMQQQLAAMPPEQRKQMEAMMARQGASMMQPGKGGGMSVRVCMSKEQVERGDVPMQEGCRITSQSRSGNTSKIAYTCSNPPSSGEGSFTYLGPEGYSSRMTVKTSMQGRTETMQMEGSGKWLSADCGGLKPMPAPRK